MRRRPPESTRTDTSFPTRRSSDLVHRAPPGDFLRDLGHRPARRLGARWVRLHARTGRNEERRRHHLPLRKSSRRARRRPHFLRPPGPPRFPAEFGGPAPIRHLRARGPRGRKGGVLGKRGAIQVDAGGCRILKKKTITQIILYIRHTRKPTN